MKKIIFYAASSLNIPKEKIGGAETGAKRTFENLVNNGFDVWLTNTRGNAVSFEHENPKEYDSSKIDSKYWNFSFHEMALYDLPANVNYIKQNLWFIIIR